MFKLATIVKECEAYHETNVTYDTEIQKQIIDINSNINELFSLSMNNSRNANANDCFDGNLFDEIHTINERLNNLQEKEKNEEKKNNKKALHDVLSGMSNALTQHNNTIVTHFGLNEAYGVDVINSINKNLHHIRKVNTDNMRNEHSLNTQRRIGIDDTGSIGITVNSATEENKNKREREENNKANEREEPTTAAIKWQRYGTRSNDDTQRSGR